MKRVISLFIYFFIFFFPLYSSYGLTLTAQDVTTITAQVGPTIQNVSTTTSTVIGGMPIKPEIVISPTSISFSGKFFSFANVVILQDGQEFISGTAVNDGTFFLLKTGMTPGVYTFSVFVELASGKRVLIATFHVTIAYGAYVKIENIKIPPFLWDVLFPQHTVVNLKNYCTTVIADFNCDERVDLVDLSILQYWYRLGKYSSNKDLNDDKKIDIGDFSVLAYYWTG